jgi:hypothetical protein
MKIQGKLITVVAFLFFLVALAVAPVSAGPAPIKSCDMSGIGSVTLVADGPPVTILDAAPATAGSGSSAVPYCLVKVLVPQAIHIWVGLPTEGKWNQRLQSLGGGGYAGSVSAPTSAVLGGYVGITTDTGHTGGTGSFGMIPPVPPATIGSPNIPLQIDFSYRSEHLMAVIGKQLIDAFYGKNTLLYSYWNGCSTGGRQGLAMAQRYPEDYNGILSGAPAIHFDRFQAAQIWPQMVQYRDNGGVVSTAKKTLATNAAIAACDALDGVVDGVLRDPRDCTYDAQNLVSKSCLPTDNSCLTETEASAINKMWYGPTNEKGNKRLWYGLTRGTNLDGLGGATPFSISVNQPRYWVYLDPTWDWHVLDYDNYEAFFDDTIFEMAASGTATDNQDLAPFRDYGSKIIIWHGFNDQLIMPEGTIDYYDRVVNALGGEYYHTQEFARLFMAPGVAHCGGGAGPVPQNLFNYVANWVENGEAPETILAAKIVGGVVTETRPLCPYPKWAYYNGSGDINLASSFTCKDDKNDGNFNQFGTNESDGNNNND